MRARHLLLLLLVLLATPASADKSYRMPGVTIIADLAEDGSMRVREERTYRFKGRFKYAYRTYALDERIRYEDFRVSENGQPFTLNDSKEPGTYQVTAKDDEIEVRWFYRARNETRTFAIEYQVQDAVHRHRDAAVLYYKFIGDGFRKKTGQVQITVNPPAPVEDWKVRQWAHGPLWAESQTTAQGVVRASCTKLPRRRFFELRILYPPELFPAAFERAGYISEAVTDEEAAWAEEANEKRRRAIESAKNLEERQAVALLALPVVVILFWAYFLWLWRSQKSLYPDAPSGGSLPSKDLPPALVSYLLNSRTVAASSLMATLMDLGRRGFVEFREEYEASTGFLRKEKWTPQHRWVLNSEHLQARGQDLEPFEKELLEFVFEGMTGQKSTTVEVEQFQKNKSKVKSFFGQWSSRVMKEGQRRDWFAAESFQARNKGLWLGSGLAFLGFVLLFVVHAVGLIAIVPGLIMTLCATALVRPTAEGARQISRWKGLRRQLKKGDFRQEGADINAFLIYGVLFGMSKNRLQDLGGMARAGDMGWYYPAAGHHGGDFGASFSAAVSVVNSAMSSSTGSGGGASGGGGGGAGGGGGGAG